MNNKKCTTLIRCQPVLNTGDLLAPATPPTCRTMRAPVWLYQRVDGCRPKLFPQPVLLAAEALSVVGGSKTSLAVPLDIVPDSTKVAILAPLHCKDPGRQGGTA
jgi:hypothetical protein